MISGTAGGPGRRAGSARGAAAWGWGAAAPESDSVSSVAHRSLACVGRRRPRELLVLSRLHMTTANQKGRLKRRRKSQTYAARRAAQREQQQQHLLVDAAPTSQVLADEVHSTAAFEKYYNAQGIIEAHEWQEFLAALHRPLPVTFRFSAMPDLALTVSGFKERWQSVWPQGATELPVPGAWQLPYDRTTLAARECPVTRDVHRWLGAACSAGAAQRQELVSMVPVALLDVQPHHLCLDLCASPGSKTTQCLERVSGSGAVVANDMKPLRAFTLSKRCRALGSACARLAVVTHRAQALPSILGAGGQGSRRGFDRIVCDVPCTGDGAIRKAPELWRYWEPHLGRQLHSIQLQLAMRAASLLVAGGVMAYSTCSLNPLENEAVVASLLAQSGGELELLQTDHLLPELYRRPGITSWKVFDDKMHHLKRFEDSQRKRVSKSLRRCWRRSMWPPAHDGAAAILAVLPRCMRLVPHLHDSGGFFVALLRRRPSGSTMVPRSVADKVVVAPRGSGGRQYHRLSARACRRLAAGLGLDRAESKAFAKALGHELYAADATGTGDGDGDGEDLPRTVVRLSPAAATMLADACPSYRPVCAGVRVLVRRAGRHELVQDGAAQLLPALPARCVARLPLSEVRRILLAHSSGDAPIRAALGAHVCLLACTGIEAAESMVACRVEPSGALRLLASRQQIAAALAALGG